MKNCTSLNKSLNLFILLFFFFIQTNPNKATQIFFDKPINIEDGCYLPAPKNAKIEKVNSYSASVKWDVVAGNDGYIVRIYEVVNDVFNPIPVQEYRQQDTFRLFTNLASGRRYKIAIGAVCPQTQEIGSRDGANVAIVYAVVYDEVVFSVRPTNPFNNQINTSYEVATPGIVNMGIYDTNGTEVIPIVTNEYKEQGTYQIDIKTEGVKPGMYFLNFRREGTVKTLKLMKLN
jgi:hypothetical protein